MSKKKLIIMFSFLLILFISLFISSIFNGPKTNIEETFLIDSNINIEEQTLEVLLREDFETNEYVTVGQLLVFFSRVNDYNVSTYDEAKKFAYKQNVYLPSDLVYNPTEWENLWRDMMLGKVVFEKTNENTYAVNLIKGYLTIYLNQQGYDLMTQGLIPPQLYMYSPFSDVRDLESINLNKNATFGMLLDVLMSCKLGEEKDEVIKDILLNKVYDISGKNEAEWTTQEVSLYNYYALSYYGEFEYCKQNGYIENMEFKDIMKSVSVGETLILYDKMINNNG